jgi:mannose-6-phosphate isomerase-like protein (cupin superfamily)
MPVAKEVVHIDTSEVRLSEWRLEPGGSTRCRRHNCDVVLVPLTRGRLRIVSPNRQSIVELVPGASVVATASFDQETINDGKGPVTFVEVQLKYSARRLISA